MNKVEKYYIKLYEDAVNSNNYKYNGVQYFYKNPSELKIDAELSILRKNV